MDAKTNKFALNHEDQEIIRHSIIGGLVAVALVAFHRIAETVAERWSKSPSEPIRFIGQTFGWVALFVIVFAAILMAGQYIRRRQWTAKISLDDVGCIDGQWIDVVVSNGEIMGAGVFFISSAQGDGFSLRGSSYRVVTGNGLDPSKRSSWTASGGTAVGGDQIAYVFKGSTALGRDHSGVGLKRFTNQGAPDLFYDGSFLSQQESIAFHTRGRRISRDFLPEGDALAILADYLSHPQVADFAASRRFEVRNPSAT